MVARARIDGLVSQLLTDAEHALIDKLGQCAGEYRALAESDGRDPDRYPWDLAEFTSHIHDLQARIMSRAAARAYPDRYRKL